MSYTTPYRKCPAHGNDLELFSYNDSTYSYPKKWFCSECDGYWTESYFLNEFEKDLASRMTEGNFQASCPKCGSSELERSCSISCCNGHLCQQCGHDFDMILSVVKESNLSKVSLEELRKKVWLEDSDYLTISEIEHCEHRADIGIYPEYGDHPECEKGDEDEVPMTLMVDHKTADERMRFWWYCTECKCGFSDASCAEAVSREHIFTSRKQGADIVCRNCKHPYFDQKENGDGRCKTCDMEFVLKYAK